MSVYLKQSPYLTPSTCLHLSASHDQKRELTHGNTDELPSECLLGKVAGRLQAFQFFHACSNLTQI